MILTRLVPFPQSLFHPAIHSKFVSTFHSFVKRTNARLFIHYNYTTLLQQCKRLFQLSLHPSSAKLVLLFNPVLILLETFLFPQQQFTFNFCHRLLELRHTSARFFQLYIECLFQFVKPLEQKKSGKSLLVC